MHLGRILLYPIKSLDGVEVQEAQITSGGSLAQDRAYAIFDLEGKVVNGKRHAKIHQLRSEFSPDFREVRLSTSDHLSWSTFVLEEPAALNDWLGGFFGFPVQLVANHTSGFPDDREAFGPTVIGTSSLSAVAGWFPGLTVENVRRRFRTNLELVGEDAPAFCEDQFYGPAGHLLPFTIGTVHFLGHNPCQRCAVPTRDPDLGVPVANFQKQFMELRKNHLPSWAEVSRFNHFYRLALNTSLPTTESGKWLRLGDLVDKA